EALAAADAAPEIHAARDRRPGDQLGDGVAATRLVVDPLVLAALERLERAQLGGVGLVAAFGERLLVELSDAHSDASARRAAPKGAAARSGGSERSERGGQKFRARLSTASAASLVASL